MASSDSTESYRGQFANREDAGRQLARALARYRDQHPLVLALPRGGVPVGFEIARALEAPLDVLFVRKLRTPGFPELALGAIVDGPQTQRILNQNIIDSMQVPDDYIESEVAEQSGIIAERKRLYRGSRPPPAIAGRTVIITDDGVATGATMRAGLKALASAGARRIVLAVPVAPQETLEILAAEADEVVCLLSPADFYSVGFYYADFDQTTDDEVVDLLERQAEPAASA